MKTDGPNLALFRCQIWRLDLGWSSVPQPRFSFPVIDPFGALALLPIGRKLPGPVEGE